MRNIVLIMSILVFTEMLVCVACSGPNDIIPVLKFRTVDVSGSYLLADTTEYVSSIPNECSAPLTARVRIYISLGDDPMDYTVAEPITKVEIQFDEREGWLDVTDTEAWFVAETDPEPSFDDTLAYTFTEPGEYTIRARATFWDGEVVDEILVGTLPMFTILASD